MSVKIQRAFSLVELMTTVAITIVILAGVVTTFSKISSSATNTSKSASLTNTGRGIATTIGTDIANAGRGFSDLMMLNIHYTFSETFYKFGDGEMKNPHMYAISDLRYNDTTEASELTLHYFDYDVAKNPSFFFLPSEAELDAKDWGTPSHDTFEGGQLYTNDSESLQLLEAGDIILVYPLAPLVGIASQDQTTWEAYDGRNQAVILQIKEVGDIEEDTDELHDDFNGLTFRMEITFGEGSVFSNKLEFPLDLIPDPDNKDPDNEDPDNSEVVVTAVNYTEKLAETRGSGYLMQPQFWVARKLGDDKSFNRITYQVVLGDDGNTKVISRTRNGTPELVATNVDLFKVRLGLDIVPTEAENLETLPLESIDGRVSRMDPNAWTMGKDEDENWDNVTEDNYRIAIGRHTLQVEVEFRQMGSVDKTSRANEDGQAFRQSRGFVEQYRLRNVTAPIYSKGEGEE